MIGGNKGKIAFIVETGWRGMREASLEFFKKGEAVDIIVKGKLNKEILDIITRPGERYRILSTSRLFFGIYLFSYLIWRRARKDLQLIIVSKKRTRNWVGAFGSEMKLLIEKDAGYELR